MRSDYHSISIELVIEEFIGGNPEADDWFMKLMNDRYGNFAIKTAYTIVSDQDKIELGNKII